MTIQKLGSFFTATPELHQLYAHTSHLRQLQQVLEAALPAALATACNVSSLQQGILTVHAENGAVALKLKQMAPRLLQLIQERDSNVSNLRIIVQIRDRHQVRKRNKPNLSAQGCSILSEFAENLQDTPLKSALTRIVRHHKR